MASFPMTIAVLKRAVSRMPMSTIHVTSSTMPKAGRLKMIRRPANCGAVCHASASCSTRDRAWPVNVGGLRGGDLGGGLQRRAEIRSQPGGQMDVEAVEQAPGSSPTTRSPRRHC